MTSKMKSLYLEGYNYTIFDLTREDRVQIQVRFGSFEKYQKKRLLRIEIIHIGDL